ncbi:MAG: DUF1329 domain-containing protein [Gammaproteobacteria bacterium]|nr:DUF1329 domain-containing protein [Gammaproteobacteria bacterium]NND60304.1 DUF1329 domain-containing protein [Gammaproteobacteria bacterium]
MRKYLISIPLYLLAGAVIAAVSPEQAERLGKDLTPMGAERAGNADGTIPAWEGGITEAPEGYQPGDHHPDPFADDDILFTITAANYKDYADKLSAGHIALFEAYPDTYKMHIYPTRRSFSAPQAVYDATRRIATTAELAEGGNGVRNATVGVPFPIPASGVEVIWNHILRWRATSGERFYGQAAVTRNGKFTLVQFSDQISVPYATPGISPEELDNVIIFFKEKTVAPARLAGRVLLVHETLDQAKENRKAWVYNPGQRRVRRAPNVAFDNPRSGSDGLMTSDQYDMYNGSPQRYNWEMIGKREIFVPYNAYKVHSDQLKYEDYIDPLHVDPEQLRYELHRVWVIDSTLKDNMRHVYKRRTFYIDEDSWQILVVDIYDNRDQLWRVSEGHGINYYDVKNFWTTLELHYDLQSGRYLAFGLDNEAGMYNLSKTIPKEEFTTGALRRAGTR